MKLLFWKSKTSKLKELLPAYLNGSLTGIERQAVLAWLDNDPDGQVELEKWKTVKKCVAEQPLVSPPPALEQRILTQARTTTQLPINLSNRRWLVATYLSGLALTLGIFVLLWLVIRPGIVLAWTVHDGDLSTYRLYRAPLGTQEYELLAQVPARPSVQQYTYIDALLLPGQAYNYLVEGVGQTGQSATSEIVRGNGSDILPAQISLLLSSIIIGFGVVTLFHLVPFRKPTLRGMA